MVPLKSLLRSKTLDIFRGYVRNILIENSGHFTQRSTTFCIYKQVPDILSRVIKNTVLHILDNEGDLGVKDEAFEVIEFDLQDFVTDYHFSRLDPKLPIESKLNGEINKIAKSRRYGTNSFLIIELPLGFGRSDSRLKYETNHDADFEDGADSDDTEEIVHYGIFNTTTSEPSNRLEESVYRVLTRFVERIKMQENYNIHLILLSPYSKPPNCLLGKGMIEIYLPIEWESNKTNLARLVEEIFEGSNIGNDVLEMIIASNSSQENAISGMVELCYELKHSLIDKYVGRELLRGEKVKLENLSEIKFEDVQEFLHMYNLNRISSRYSSSIDSLIATKISIERDFVGLNDLRESIKESIYLLGSGETSSISTEDEVRFFGYPITWFLWGGTGSGKSTLVRSMVSVSPKVNVLLCNVIDLISPLHGVTTRNLRKVFKNALSSRPAILVFDDVETLMGTSLRGSHCEGEVRAKINRELTSTLIYLLESVISVNHSEELSNEIFSRLAEVDFTGKSTGAPKDQINYKVSRKISGLMIVMTSRANIQSIPMELLGKIQKHSFLQFPTTQELLEDLCKIGDPRVVESARETADELKAAKGERLLNVSEFKSLVQEKLYRKHLNSKGNK
ncbi:AAA superfamily ATPase [Cryptosporidium felis]|nr:AAA superfamily ATPase [Cryptosporidium felis]